MAYADKAALKAAIRDALDREDLTELQLDRFIRDAETRANRLLRLRDDECRATAPVSAGEQYVSLPGNFAGVTEVNWTDAAGTVTNLKRVSHKVAADRLQEGASGTPEFYSIVSDTYWLIPTPAEAGTLNMIGKERFELVEDSDSNALLRDNADIYFHGTAYEAAAFLKEPMNEVANHERLFLAGIRELRISDWHDKAGGSRGEEAEYF